MRITVIADSHKNLNALNGVVSMNSDSDLFIHLGDGFFEYRDITKMYPTKNFIFIKGETDHCDEKSSDVIVLGGYNVFVTHGDAYDTSNLDEIVETALFKKCQIALYAHTHVYKTELVDGVYVMNPGSIDSPRGKAPRTYGVIEISTDGVIKMDIIELSLDE